MTAVEQLRIPKGSQVMIGAPAYPPPAAHVAAIASFMSSIHEVIEAHLVQCCFPAVPNSECQAIVVVIEPKGAVPAIVDRIVSWLSDTIPNGREIYVWNMESTDSILRLVREAEGVLVPRSCGGV